MSSGYWEKVHEENKDGFIIKLWLAPETESPDWDFESEEEEKELYRKIDSGLLLWFVAKVTAEKAGVELSADYLGGCCYESVDDFLSGGYYDDMRDAAITEAKNKLEELKQ